jgi:hypothetical protein
MTHIRKKSVTLEYCDFEDEYYLQVTVIQNLTIS